MKGEKRDRQTAKQSCQPLGKLKIKKIEGGKEKEIKIYNKKWNKINSRKNEVKWNKWIIKERLRVKQRRKKQQQKQKQKQNKKKNPTTKNKKNKTKNKKNKKKTKQKTKQNKIKQNKKQNKTKQTKKKQKNKNKNKTKKKPPKRHVWNIMLTVDSIETTTNVSIVH